MKRDVRSTRRGDRIALALIGSVLTTAAVLALLVATDTILDVHDDTPGHTTIDGRAFANAFEADVRRHPDVLDARADMLLDRGVVRVRLTAADDVDVERLVHDAVHPAVTRLTTVAELATPPTPQVDLRLRPRSGRALQ